MMKSGNSDVMLCADILLKTIRGEVPMERLKGIDARIIDRPAIEARKELEQDVEWVMENYEPRFDMQDVSQDEIDPLFGQFQLNVFGGATS